MLGVLFICIAVSALYLLWFSTTVEMTNFYIKGFNFSLFHGSLPSCTCDMLSWRCIGSNIQHWPFCWNFFFYLIGILYANHSRFWILYQMTSMDCTFCFFHFHLISFFVQQNSWCCMVFTSFIVAPVLGFVWKSLSFQK